MTEPIEDRQVESNEEETLTLTERDEDHDQKSTTHSLEAPPAATLDNSNPSDDDTPTIMINDQATPTPHGSTHSQDDDTTSSNNSTIAPDDSVNEQDYQPTLSEFKGPIVDFYRHKNILMTGVTGFVGKAVLWKLIKALQEDIGQIYILVRSGSIKKSKIGRPSERLRNEIFNNKV